MKRFLAIFFMIIILISITACKKTDENTIINQEISQKEINQKIEFYNDYLNSEQFKSLEFDAESTSREYTVLNHTVTKQYSENGTKRLKIQVNNYSIMLYVSPENQQLVHVRVPNDDFSQTIAGWYRNEEINFEESLSDFFHTEEVDTIIPTIKTFAKSVKYVKTVGDVDFTIFTVDDGNKSVEIEAQINTNTGKIISFDNVEIDNGLVNVKLLPTTKGGMPNPQTIRKVTEHDFADYIMMFHSNAANDYLLIQ